MPGRIEIIGPKDPRQKEALNVTSLSKDWTKAFSPMVLGPVKLPNGSISKKMENAWQFCKVYPEHWNEETKQPNAAWVEWSKAGFGSWKSERYPLGRDKKPIGSWWNGKLIGYLEARRHIYAPLYAQAVLATPEWPRLLKWYQETENPILWDVDGYKRGEGTLLDMALDPSKTMGHAVVLAMVIHYHDRLGKLFAAWDERLAGLAIERLSQNGVELESKKKLSPDTQSGPTV